jgi:predicted O-methyltransferase YrrM
MIEEIIEKINKFNLENGNPNWNISYDTGKFLSMISDFLKTEKILEIGTSTGFSGLWFLKSLIKRNGVLYTVESNPNRFLEAEQNFKDAGVFENIRQIRGHAPECLENLEETFDLMFFDATKREHRSYFEFLEKKLKIGGLIIADNVLSHEEKMLPYREFVESLSNYETVLVPIGTGLLFSKKM